MNTKLSSNFKFVLSEEALRMSSGTGRGVEFEAQIVDDDTYLITWNDEELDEPVYYSNNEVIEYTRCGDWIIVK